MDRGQGYTGDEQASALHEFKAATTTGVVSG
jgi:hypothetical protein